MTVYKRHRRWLADGTWGRVLDELRAGCDAFEGQEWAVSVDSTIVRAHRHGAGARFTPPGDFPLKGGGTRDEPDGREAIGKSRGGWTSKIHLAVDRRCRPVSKVTSPGQRADCRVFDQVMDAIRIERRGVGRPRTRPARTLADKAYSNRAIRNSLRRWRIKTVIPEKEDQTKHRANRGSKGGLLLIKSCGCACAGLVELVHGQG